jgi:RNA polymerase sigma-70 factor (ECF subfamily)
VGTSLTVTPRIPGWSLHPEGKADEFVDVFGAHVDFVWRALRRLGVADADAEDALQDVFIVVYRKLHEYEERGTIRGWLFAISRQVACHYRRTQARRQRRESIPPRVAGDDDPHRAAMRREAVAIVQEFLAQLDEERAIVFYLSEVEGMAAPEIASSLGANLNTVYGRLIMSRKQFEDFLERRTARAR